MKNIITTLLRSACALVLISTSFSVIADETLRGPGDWVKKSYRIAGEWEIISRDDARFIVFNEDFKTKKGPDLKVYLSRMPISDIEDHDVVHSSIKISALKSNKGHQEYPIPADIILDEYSSMLIHCEAYTHLWGGASLD